MTPRAQGLSSYRTRPVLLALFASGLLAGAADAQITFEARTRFALGFGEEAVPITEPIFVTHPGTFDFTLQMGIFNASGFTNYGVGFWSGTIFSSEPLLSRPQFPRVFPFNGPYGYDGNINAQGTRIGLPGQRQIEPTRGETVYYYNEGDPVPGLPPPVGANEYADLYRFSITIGDLSTEREITIRAEGQNWPIEGFHLFQHVPPDPDTGEPGFVWWSPNPAGNGPAPAQPSAVSLLTLRVVPAPGAIATIGLLGLCAVIRRRRR